MSTIVSDIKIKITEFTGKLAGMRGINTNTLTNPWCISRKNSPKKTICSICYSYAMLEGSRKNCAKPWQRNSNIFEKILPLENLPRIMDRVFRFHGHGELINKEHYLNFCNIAKKNPETTFALWTKRKDLVRNVKRPENMILIYSNPTIDKVKLDPPKGFDKVFNNVSGSHKLENCTGQKCVDCLKCYTKSDHPVIVEKTKIRT